MKKINVSMRQKKQIIKDPLCEGIGHEEKKSLLQYFEGKMTCREFKRRLQLIHDQLEVCYLYANKDKIRHEMSKDDYLESVSFLREFINHKSE